MRPSLEATEKHSPTALTGMGLGSPGCWLVVSGFCSRKKEINPVLLLKTTSNDAVMFFFLNIDFNNTFVLFFSFLPFVVTVC